MLKRLATEILFLSESLKVKDSGEVSDLLRRLCDREEEGAIAEPFAFASKLFFEADELYNQVTAGSWDKRYFLALCIPLTL